MTFVVAWVSGDKAVTYRDQNGAETTNRGGTRSWRNNNPGNIVQGVFSEGQGSIGDDGKFAIFADEATGRNAIITLFLGPAYAGLSLRNAFYRYAPPADDNDTEAYIAAVARRIGVSPDAIIRTLTRAQLEKLADAIKSQEGWKPGETSGAAPPAVDAQLAALDAGAGSFVTRLVGIGSDPTKCAGIVASAKQAMVPIYGYPTLHNACACTLSLFLKAAGMNMNIIYGAGALAHYLEDKCRWTHVDKGGQQAGDVAVCRDNDQSIPGADHIFLVVKRVDDDKMLIADNQGSQSPHTRFASGAGGKTPVAYFLRAPSGALAVLAVASQLPDDSVVERDEPSDHLLVRYTEAGLALL